MRHCLLHKVLFVASCLYPTAAHAQAKTLQLTQTIRLPGVEGRIDHMELDATSDRLFVCALGNNTVEVLDVRKGERIHSITGLGAPQGIAYLPELNRIFVANDKGGICKIYDGKSFQAVGELDLKDDADNVRYDDATKKIYVGFGSGPAEPINYRCSSETETVSCARTGLFVPEIDTLFSAVPHHSAQRAAVRVYHVE